MTEPGNETQTTDPQSRLRERQESADITPEIAERRLAELRREVPQALVQIDAVRADDVAIAVKVVIGLPGGARHSAIASADVDEGTSWSEQMEQVQAVAVARALNGLLHRPSRPTVSQPSQSLPAQPAPTESVQDDDHLPEYSWNAFWKTVNSRNITRDQVEQALGRPVLEATPKEAVDALTAAGLL